MMKINSIAFTVLLIANNFLFAQVPVRLEPRHHNVFENGYVRVLDVHISPGDTTLFHIHETPSVFIVLSNALSGSEVKSEGAITNAQVTHGIIWFDGFYDKPRIHRVWNNDTIEFHVMDVELLNKNYKDIGPPEQENGLRILSDEKPVSLYTGAIKPRSTTTLVGKKFPRLFVFLSDVDGNVSINDKPFAHKGDFIFIATGEVIKCINRRLTEAQFALLDLK